jgi:hypothetical protein
MTTNRICDITISGKKRQFRLCYTSLQIKSKTSFPFASILIIISNHFTLTKMNMLNQSTNKLKHLHRKHLFYCVVIIVPKGHCLTIIPTHPSVHDNRIIYIPGHLLPNRPLWSNPTRFSYF